MKVFIDGKEVEVDRVDFVHSDFPEDGEETYFKMTSEGLIVDVIEKDTGEVLRTGYQFFSDLEEIAH